jgi:hypothetical protein
VGPDASQFFEVTKAAVGAYRDVIEWFATAVRKREQEGGDLGPVFGELQAMEKDLSLPFKGTPADSYRLHKLQAIQEILRVREKMGTASVVQNRMKMLESRWPVLHKIPAERNEGLN